jgi:DNA modification methylase
MTALVVRADARHLPLPDESVDLVVTSPPFLNLRSYTDGGRHYDGQIGVGTRDQFLAELWAVTAECARVLKRSGSMFIELGDSYTDKSLNLTPERYHIGCVDRLGLLARAEIVWSRPNGLPESVTDRVRRSHSSWVHLTKAPRYYAAVDEIREAYEPDSARRKTLYGGNPGRDGLAGLRATGVAQHGSNGVSAMGVGGSAMNPLGKLPGSVWTIPTEPLRVPNHLDIDHFAAFPTGLPRRLILGWSPPGICLGCGQGRRPVVARTPMQWRPSPTLHGRNAPGTARQTASGTMLAAAESRILGYFCTCTPYTNHPGTGGRARDGQRFAAETGRDAHPHGGVGVLPRTGPWREYHLDRWTPPPTRPAVVLDPFGGTGTTALCASVLGRIGDSEDLSQDYARLARWRTRDPGERARAMRVDKPEPVSEGQLTLFGEEP